MAKIQDLQIEEVFIFEDLNLRHGKNVSLAI